MINQKAQLASVGDFAVDALERNSAPFATCERPQQSIEGLWVLSRTDEVNAH